MNTFFADSSTTSKANTFNARPFNKQRRKRKHREKNAAKSSNPHTHCIGPSGQRKSFAEIVRKNTDEDPIKPPSKPPPPIRAIEAGEVGALGHDFRTIENSSVRSVLENLFREPEQRTQTEASGIEASQKLSAVNNEVCSSCVHKLHDAPQPISMPQLGTSILDSIFDEEKWPFVNSTQHHRPRNTTFTTSASSNVVNFNYNLSELLYQRIKQPPTNEYPSTFFVCPRCGEMTNLETSDLERLGSIGDRCITNFSTRFQGSDIFSGQYSRRYNPIYNQSSSSAFAYKNNFAAMNRTSNSFGGLNARKKNRVEMKIASDSRPV